MQFFSFHYMLHLHSPPPPSSRISQITTFFDYLTAFLTPQLSKSLALVLGDFNKFSTRPLTLLGLDNIIHFFENRRLRQDKDC